MAQGLTGSLLALALLSAGCSPTEPAGQAPPSQQMEGFTMTRTRGGEKVWELSSPRARLRLEGGAVIEKPEIRFFSKGVHATTANADSGVVEAGSNDVRLEGSVVIVAIKEKTRLSTDRLDYSSKDERFRTEDVVLIERPDARVRGRGLVADAALSDITIREQETLLR
ncbi:MAG: LPS export ABC transporter periplasmic protein LptC [Elusimicrobia bacterium CG1_02_63_36]|nr:MAG: LPS export ABC transporter periplasmic protein LptC [Elusimicrobia bacterium CG1_02_63_36]